MRFDASAANASGVVGRMGWSYAACWTGAGSIHGRDLARSAGQGGSLARPRGSDRQRTTRIVLAAAHVNHDPARSGPRNLRAWCQACHFAHDRAWHLLQRWITFRLRYARGDLFLGPYQHGPSAAILLSEILARTSGRLSHHPGYGTASAGEIERIRASVAGLKISAGGVAAVWWLPAAVGAGRLVLLASHRDQVSQIVFVDSDPAIGIARLPSDDGA